jgi:hypothetical protein
MVTAHGIDGDADLQCSAPIYPRVSVMWAFGPGTTDWRISHLSAEGVLHTRAAM